MKANILVVDDEAAILIALERLLTGRGHHVETAASGEAAIDRLGRGSYDLVVTDLTLEPLTGMDVLRWTCDHAEETGEAAVPVILITAYGSERAAVEAMKLGAVDYLPKPFDNDELVRVVERALEERRLRRDLQLLREEVSDRYRFHNILGKSPAMQNVFERLRKVASSDLTVLILGPSGTGKELVANAVHYNSPRQRRPLIKVNCAAFSSELVESELFGHEQGAFTGATRARQGKFELADGGSLLLDEIGDMSLETQAKVLRVLQEKAFERVGGNRTIRVDVRLLAATNQNLEELIAAGKFRQDLYYRLNVVPIELPALAERAGDLPLLTEHFLRVVAEKLERPLRPLSSAAMRCLLDHAWEGNVRELEHAIEHAVVLADGEAIELGDLPASIRGPGAAAVAMSESVADAPLDFKEAKQRAVDGFEREFISRALERHRGNVTRAAEEMGMYRQHLQLKVAKLGLDPRGFRES
ncbi:MAG: sigma-54 dependent transcriptional regulator [Acidobacteriota bacterium]